MNRGTGSWAIRMPILALALTLSGCPTDGDGGSDPGGSPDAALPDAGGDEAGFSGCGSPDHLDDAPEFVGSCTTKADSQGDQNCTEYVTIALAPSIGTGCLERMCGDAGSTWGTGHCASGMTFCKTWGDASSLLQSLYSTNEVACAAAAQ